MTIRPREEARRHSERPHVLIVSDDPGLIQFLNEGLPLGGFWTSVISNGIQVMEVFRLRQFDIVVIDAGLQSFGSLELVRRLRGQSTRDARDGKRTDAPIVLISEQPSAMQPAELDELAVARELVAPLEIEDVVVELHRVFAEWRQANPREPLSDDPFRSNR